MSDDIPSIISHVSLGTNDFEKAVAFYDKVMASLGARRIMQHGEACAWGRAFPEFWVQAPFDGQAAAVANGVHVSFFASSRDEVDAFHAAALAAGGTDDDAPGYRPEYGAPYYGCFLRDLDGHKIEATFWDEAMAATEESEADA